MQWQLALNLLRKVWRIKGSRQYDNTTIRQYDNTDVDLLLGIRQYITDHDAFQLQCCDQLSGNQKKQAVTLGAGRVCRDVAEHRRIHISLATDLRSALQKKNDSGSWLCTCQERYDRKQSTPTSSVTVVSVSACEKGRRWQPALHLRGKM